LADVQIASLNFSPQQEDKFSFQPHLNCRLVRLDQDLITEQQHSIHPLSWIILILASPDAWKQAFRISTEPCGKGVNILVISVGKSHLVHVNLWVTLFTAPVGGLFYKKI
jgi:hypothetical protein